MGLRFRGLGFLGFRDSWKRVIGKGNQIEKHMGNEMKTKEFVGMTLMA